MSGGGVELVERRPWDVQRLLVPEGARVEWAALQAALAEWGRPVCAGECAALWVSGRASESQVAALGCRLCAVMPECRAYGVAAREPVGVWGATTPAERLELGRTR